VEDAASGTGLIQSVQRKAMCPMLPIERPTQQGKLARVMDVLGYIDSGFVCVPEEAPWMSDFTEECDAFAADDSHDHDDQIDPMVDAIITMVAVGYTSMAVSDEALNEWG
jgi:predicted phage terminase large subunit-like protein